MVEAVNFGMRDGDDRSLTMVSINSPSSCLEMVKQITNIAETSEMDQF